MDASAPVPDRGRGMTVADLQAYLVNLSDAVAAATRSDDAAGDMRLAAEAMRPFAHLSIAGLAALLTSAQAHTTTGKIQLVISG